MDSSAIDTAYVLAFWSETRQILINFRHHPMAEDVAQSEALKVMEHVDIIRTSYPDPQTYARVRSRHAGIDHDRRQAVQRGEGARLTLNADGTLQRLRQVVSGDVPHPHTGRTLFDDMEDPETSFEDNAGRRDELAKILDHSLAKHPKLAKHVVFMVKGEGRSITETAALLGIRREQASRLLNNALGAIYQHIDDQQRS